jgi:SMC interacting uncharacterized protein involved in chromosome segregation
MPEEETQPAPPAPTNTVIQPAQELTQPVIDHAAAIARIEERQAKQEEDLGRRIMESEERINSGINGRFSSIEEKLTAALTPPVKEVEETPAELEEAVDVTRHTPEKRRGIRGRRKARRSA